MRRLRDRSTTERGGKDRGYETNQMNLRKNGTLRSGPIRKIELEGAAYFAFFCFCWPTRILKCACFDSWYAL